MSYEIWAGTPNEMVQATTPKHGLPEAIKWACSHLAEKYEKDAEKFDHAALAAIRATKEQMRQVYRIPEGDRRGWEFSYINITFRIEIRRTK
jgi:hypothetical protein